MIEFFHAVEFHSRSRKPPGSTQALTHVVEELCIRKIDDYVLSNDTIDHITFAPVKVLTVQGAGPDAHTTPVFDDPVFDSLQLQSLTLADCSLGVLAGIAKNARLANLRSFKIQGCVSRTYRHWNVSRMMDDLFALFIQFRQLEELEVDWREALPMILGGICRNGGTLKKLTLSEPKSELFGLLTVREMQQLRDNCRRLVELKLDIHPSDLHANDRLRILSEFSDLRKLELLTDRELGGYLSVCGLEAVWTRDVDFNAAHIIMQDLHSRKKGLPFELITIRAENCPRPQGWRPHNTHLHEGCCAGTRIFYSRVNESGVYEQWGSPNYSSRLPESEWSDDESIDVP